MRASSDASGGEGETALGHTVAMSSAPVRHIRPAERRQADPTSGMIREEAIAAKGLWAGLVRTAPGVSSGWHHHANHETSIFVAVGRLLMESGPGGGQSISAEPGDFVHVPAGIIHRETNDGDVESHLVVVRAGSGPTTVNVEGPEPAES